MLLVIFLFAMTFVSCRNMGHSDLPQPISRIHLPFQKSNFLRYPIRFYSSNNDSIIIDYSCKNYFYTLSLSDYFIDSFLLPKKLEKEFFIRINSEEVIFLPRELDSFYLLNNNQLNSFKLPDELNDYYLSQPLVTGIYHNENSLYFGLGLKDTFSGINQYIKSIKTAPVFCQYNLIDESCNMFGAYPKSPPYNMLNSKYNRTEFIANFTVLDSDKIVVVFPYTDSIYFYFSNKIKALPIEELNMENNKKLNCDVYSHYDRLYIDPFRRKLYISKQICDKNNLSLSQYERAWEILQYNWNYKLEKKIKINPKQYVPSYLVVLPAGILLSTDFTSNATDTSNYKTYDLFEAF